MTKGRKVALGVAVALAVCLVLAFVDPTSALWPFHCPFKLITGLQCPGCGFQRALHALLQGDVMAAARYNFFLLYAIPYLLLIIVSDVLPNGKWQLRLQALVGNKYVVWFYILSFFVWLVVRNVLGI